MGTHANAMEKRGIQSDRGQINKKIKELNSQIENIEKENVKAISEFNELNKEEKEKYRFITLEEKEIIKKAENIVKKQLDREIIDSSVNKLNNIRRVFVDELNKLKFDPYSLKEDIRLMKGWNSDIENHKKQLEELPKNLFGRYKDKSAAAEIQEIIKIKEKSLENRGYKDKNTILIKEKKLNDIENRINELNNNINAINKQVKILEKSCKILDLKECRQFYSEYKEQFPQAKYLSLQGVRSIKAVNEYCGYKVDIDKIAGIYQDMKKEFNSSGISGANDMLEIFEKAIKTISYVRNYDEKLTRESEQQKELGKSRKKSRDRGMER